MSNSTYGLIIIGMLGATYLPRVLPFYLIKKEKIPKSIYIILSYIPYAMLGAMIMPGFISGIEGQPLISWMAFIGGVGVCFRYGGTMIPIVTAIAIATILQIFI